MTFVCEYDSRSNLSSKLKLACSYSILFYAILKFKRTVINQQVLRLELNHIFLYLVYEEGSLLTFSCESGYSTWYIWLMWCNVIDKDQTRKIFSLEWKWRWRPNAGVLWGLYFFPLWLVLDCAVISSWSILLVNTVVECVLYLMKPRACSTPIPPPVRRLNLWKAADGLKPAFTKTVYFQSQTECLWLHSDRVKYEHPVCFLTR